MHGVRKGTKVSAAEREQEARRSATNASLIRRSLDLRNKPLPNPISEEFRSTFQVVDAAVEANPDEYSLWAFRREVLLAEASQNGENVDFDELWKQELSLTMRALRRHPKAYPAWQHRLWLIEDSFVASWLSPGKQARAREDENKLSAMMLSKDGRNFHGWAHRMRVRAALLTHDPSSSQKLDQREMKYVEEMVNRDFANYSAWHHRSALLPRLQEVGDEVIERELEFVQQAFFTEPDVQSVWFYHRWLLAGAPDAREKGAVTVGSSMLKEQLDVCDTLLEIEPEARLALQEKAYILEQLGHEKERGQVLERLGKIDPMRRGYYRYLRERKQDSRDGSIG